MPLQLSNNNEVYFKSCSLYYSPEGSRAKKRCQVLVLLRTTSPQHLFDSSLICSHSQRTVEKAVRMFHSDSNGTRSCSYVVYWERWSGVGAMNSPASRSSEEAQRPPLSCLLATLTSRREDIRAITSECHHEPSWNMACGLTLTWPRLHVYE